MAAWHLQCSVCHNAACCVDFQVPKVQWDDVGGLEGVKQGLKEAVEWPHLHPEALARLGAQPLKGNFPSSSLVASSSLCMQQQWHHGSYTVSSAW